MYCTIRETAKLDDPRLRGVATEHGLRQMLRQKRLPGVYTGKTFRVNVDALIQQLEDEVQRSVCKGSDEV